MASFSFTQFIHFEDLYCSLLDDTKILHHVWLSYSVFYKKIVFTAHSVVDWLHANSEYVDHVFGVVKPSFVLFSFFCSLFELLGQLFNDFLSVVVMSHFFVFCNFLFDLFNFLFKFVKVFFDNLDESAEPFIVKSCFFKFIHELFRII